MSNIMSGFRSFVTAKPAPAEPPFAAKRKDAPKVRHQQAPPDPQPLQCCGA